MDPRSSIPPHHHLHHQQHQSQTNFTMAQSTQSLPPSVQCSPIFVEYQLMKEFVLFQKQNLAHVYLVPSHSSAFEWFGVMFIHTGLYSGMIFRFTVFISSSYPNCDVPKIVFDPIPIHPLVSKTTGELDTSFRFTKWNSTNNFIFEIIAYVKEVFEIDDVDELKKVTNNQITSLDHTTEELKAIIAEMRNQLNEESIHKSGEDKNYINFTEPENSAIIDKLRNKLISDNMTRENGNMEQQQFGRSNAFNGPMHYGSPSISGLSWTKKIVFK